MFIDTVSINLTLKLFHPSTNYTNKTITLHPHLRSSDSFTLWKPGSGRACRHPRRLPRGPGPGKVRRLSCIHQDEQAAAVGSYALSLRRHRLQNALFAPLHKCLSSCQSACFAPRPRLSVFPFASTLSDIDTHCIMFCTQIILAHIKETYTKYLFFTSGIKDACILGQRVDLHVEIQYVSCASNAFLS